ncbi:outer membrane protein [Aestuariivirga sp.]|uniref:outer membrane protein n=1 Tax=Aestuariivirga sp. TaxID=2650926 RepID=UPI00391B32BA
MKAALIPLALLAFAAAPSSSSLAADLEPPPELRPSTYDLNVGVFAAGSALDSNYVNVCPCSHEHDLHGTGFGIGARAGIDYVADGWVVGLVGDWTFGGDIAENDHDGDDASLNMNHLATLRARAGVSNGGALLYVTGGFAAAQMELGLDVPVSAHAIESDEDAQWTYGWTVGAGIDYFVTESVSLGLEYLYLRLDDVEYGMVEGAAAAYDGEVSLELDGMHTLRLGLNYAFSL